jgi:hypothetical protein
MNRCCVDVELLLGDGVVSEDEYVFGAYKVQKTVQAVGGGGVLMRRKQRFYNLLFIPH